MDTMKRQYLRAQKRKEVRRKRICYCIAFLLFLLILIYATAHIANAGSMRSSNPPRHKYFTSIQVEAGTSLWDIAQEYVTEEYDSVEDYIREVKSINHMTNDLIYGGSYLCIPYYSSEIK